MELLVSSRSLFSELLNPRVVTGTHKFLASWTRVRGSLRTPEFSANIWSKTSLAEDCALHLWNLASLQVPWYLYLSYSSHSLCQEFSLVPISKYLQNLVTCHSLHCFHTGLNHRSPIMDYCISFPNRPPYFYSNPCILALLNTASRVSQLKPESGLVTPQLILSNGSTSNPKKNAKSLPCSPSSWSPHHYLISYTSSSLTLLKHICHWTSQEYSHPRAFAALCPLPGMLFP